MRRLAVPRSIGGRAILAAATVVVLLIAHPSARLLPDVGWIHWAHHLDHVVNAWAACLVGMDQPEETAICEGEG